MSKNLDKDKALEQVLADIEKQFGKGSIMKLGEQEEMDIEVSRSGSLTLDIALGVGGYPKGRIIEIYGPESSGKTTFALHAIAEVQKDGGRAAFIDAEHSLDPVYASNLGVDTIYILPKLNFLVSYVIVISSIPFKLFKPILSYSPGDDIPTNIFLVPLLITFPFVILILELLLFKIVPTVTTNGVYISV